MNELQTLNPLDIISDDLTTTSLKIAEVFGKQHKDVLKKIDSLECSAEFRKRNFALSSKNNDLGNFKQQKYYTLTEAGSYLITFGFSGKPAMHFKEEFINAFIWMRKNLASIAKPNVVLITKECAALKRLARLGGATKYAAEQLVVNNATTYGVDIRPALTHRTPTLPMIPTELGKRLHAYKITPNEINKILLEYGYQRKCVHSNCWIPTPKGERFCEYNEVHTTKAYTSPTQILWYENILDHLRDQMNLYKTKRYEADRAAAMVNPLSLLFPQPF